ncbi:hypothetical protein CBR_g66807 [Chara braunii]|uniref:Mitochondrial carrier protein n=1 Tax=Chara braunii TaxID=69332 RepID=A0A388K9D3_CHABU|nr:hypothetical protein CBR_g66807 [Chara braunii]|eukprot:GBG66672.1 hypothetical protein CBR_g66807 [Chara braunii]
MHPVDTIKTRIQSGGQLGFAFQEYRGVIHAVTSVWKADGARGLYRGVVPGVTGSIVTGATYFGVIETTKHWLYDTRPHIVGPWSHFAAGAIGEAVGSVSYVPCEVIKQRMQLQGSRETWAATIRSSPLAAKTSPLGNYYSGMFHATRLIIKHEGIQGLYVGYRGWLHALQRIWKEEGIRGGFRGGLPRVMWFVPSSAITFCVIEALRKQFNPSAESKASSPGCYSHPDSLKSSPNEVTKTSTHRAAASMVHRPRHVHDGDVRVR